MRRLIVHLLLIVGLVSPSFAASLQKEAWPAEEDCPACFHLWVRDLDLQLPITQVYGVFSTGSQLGDVSIIPPSGRLGKYPRYPTILNRTWEDLVALFKEKPRILEQHGIHNLKDFFTALGNDSAPPDKFMTTLRKAYNLDTATRYRCMERNELTAFIVNNPDPGPLHQRIFFLVEGSNVYYEVSGFLSDEMIKLILAHAKINKMP